MDSVEAYHNQCMEDTSAQQLLSSDSPDIGDIYEDPEVTPRLGDQYQVEIPPLMTESGHLKSSATYAEGTADADFSVTVGLPIPVMWVHDVVDLTKHKHLDLLGNTISANTTKFVVSKENNEMHMNSKRSKAGQENRSLGNQMNADLFPPQHTKSNLVEKHGRNKYHPVPGSLGGHWSDIEQESFLLGLYIFGKNLVQVKRFIESKGMGDILSFYYGQFYKSEGHRRWSECQKMRSRRCIHGQRIFTGWRQQELLARLLAHASEKCANTLLEVFLFSVSAHATLGAVCVFFFFLAPFFNFFIFEHKQWEHV